MKNIKAVMFDWAGTMIDYGCIAPTYVFVEVFKDHGIEISLEDARTPMGLAKRDHVIELLKMPHILKLWEETYGIAPAEEDIDTLYADLEPALIKIAADYCKPIPGALELLNTLKNIDVKTGSSTGYVDSIMEKVIPAAEGYGLKPDSIVSSSQVPAGRPAPWMMYKNMQNLNVYPAHKMVKIGDTIADIKEGLHAGMWVIALTKSGNEIGLSETEVNALDSDEMNKRLNKANEKFLAAGAHFTAEGPWECLPILEEIDQRTAQNEKP